MGKAFEKWWKGQEEYFWDEDKEPLVAGWRAALEWVLNDVNERDPLGKDTMTWVEEELKEQ